MAHTPVLVVEDTKRRKTAAFIAIGAAAVMAAGGSTFALWSAQESFDGGTITAGDLNIAAGTTTYWDVSADRTDVQATIGTGIEVPGHAIDDIGGWRMVPGDEVAVVLPAEITLVGDNLVAELVLDTALPAADADITGGFQYAVYDDAGDVVVAKTDLPSSGVLATLQAPGTGQDDGALDGTIPVVDVTDGVETFQVVIYDTFDDVDDRTDATETDVLGTLTISLNQVRTTDEASNFAS